MHHVSIGWFSTRERHWPNWTMTQIANSLQVLKRNGGDDGTRTRGLCRDRATTRCNCLISNGVGGRRLIQDVAACHFLSSP
jgi:hypothetical protein